MRRLARFAALPVRDKGLLVECVCLLPLIAAGLRLVGFHRIGSILAGVSPRLADDGEPRETRRRRARDVFGLVRAAARHGPYRARCLEESLLLWWLLRRRGIETRLRLGVNTEASFLQAHAWVELEGRALDERESSGRRYEAFERDFAPRRLHG